MLEQHEIFNGSYLSCSPEDVSFLQQGVAHLALIDSSAMKKLITKEALDQEVAMISLDSARLWERVAAAKKALLDKKRELVALQQNLCDAARNVRSRLDAGDLEKRDDFMAALKPSIDAAQAFLATYAEFNTSAFTLLDTQIEDAETAAKAIDEWRVRLERFSDNLQSIHDASSSQTLDVLEAVNNVASVVTWAVGIVSDMPASQRIKVIVCAVEDKIPSKKCIAALLKFQMRMYLGDISSSYYIGEYLSNCLSSSPSH